MDGDFCLLILTKHGQTYCLRYDELTLGSARRQLRDWAENPELSFSWRDAAFLGDRVEASETIFFPDEDIFL